MGSTARLDHVFESMNEGAVPEARIVPDLDAALDVVRRLGGAIASEMRTAPGIGSWAFVAREDGREVLLWQDATIA
jgi:predicted enzyme related to lactoylglutathione lyase